MAGYETPAHIITNGALALLRHPEQLEGMEHLGRTAMDELLRYDSSVQITFRTVQRPTRIAGADLAEGTRVALLIGSANHDPRVFREPERLDLTRSHNPHLSFGAGIHYCLGGPLARLEAGLALGKLFRSSHVALRDPAPGHKNIAATLRGLQALPVSVTAR